MRSLRAKEAAHGPDHPEVAITLTNLCIVARAQGDLAEARRFLERALASFRKFLGEEHPHTVTARNNLRLLDQLTPEPVPEPTPIPTTGGPMTKVLDGKTPSAFLSYSWDDDEHREWVKQLAIRLTADGVEVTLDRWHAAPGSQIPAFMERAVRENDFVIAVCTPKFKEKSDLRDGGVGYEGDIMTGEVFTGTAREKFIPVLRRGSWKDAAPSWFRGSYHIDLSADPYSEAHYEDLLRRSTARGRPLPSLAPDQISAPADRPGHGDRLEPLTPPGESGPTRPGGRPHYWVMPHPRNPGFVGRGPLLERVGRTLGSGDGAPLPVALTQAISGLGGVGKTQLAIEYAHRHAEHYDAVLWVVADTPATLATGYADLARALGLPEADRADDANARIRAVRPWLESPDSGRWLLVFDNVERPEVLRGYLPTRHAGHVVVTTRRSHWPGGETVEVPAMERPESVELLLRLSGQSDAEAADRLAEALGDFPLALAQAAGYLAESGLAAGDYLEHYREHRAGLLRRGDPPDDYKLTVFATLDLAMRRIDSPDAEDLLGLIACLAPDEIPGRCWKRPSSDSPRGEWSVPGSGWPTPSPPWGPIR